MRLVGKFFRGRFLASEQSLSIALRKKAIEMQGVPHKRSNVTGVGGALPVRDNDGEQTPVIRQPLALKAIRRAFRRKRQLTGWE